MDTSAETEALLDDVRYLREEHTLWYVTFGLESLGEWAPKLIGQRADKKRFDNRVSAAAMIKPGDVFFPDKAFKNRFRFIGMTQKEVVHPRTQAKEVVMVAQYEDLKPGKAGTKYESQQGLPESEIEAHAYRDRTAVIDFGKGDGDKSELKVEEGDQVPLPGGAKDQSVLLKDVTDDAIVIEYAGAGGTRKTRSVARMK